MKFNKILSWTLFSITLLAMGSLQGCSSDKDMPWVDLRYRVEDSYLVEAKNPETISFLVKSTNTWTVFGVDGEWYTITPEQGQADSTYTVEIICNENVDLDDRIDTLTIKSDYWVGKQFLVTQKGTAFLTVGGSDFELPQADSSDTFTIASNQKWSAKVTEGKEWFSIVSGNEGEKDGTITVHAVANKGEQRFATVTIYDRHGEVNQEVKYVQDGVMLDPQIPENGKWFVTYEQEQQLTIPVESNGEWTVSKENEADSDWFTFEKTTFTGSEDLVINLSEHIGSAVRTGIVTLTSVAEEGITPVVKQVKFKQANPQIPVVNNTDRTINGGWYGPGELQPGYYNFYVGPMAAGTKFNLYLIIGDYEIRYWLQDGKTVPSTRPWCADVFIENGNCHKPVDFSKPNVISVDIKESIDENGDKWAYVEWILNGETVCYRIANGVTLAGNSDSWVMPWSVLAPGAQLYINTSGGAAKLEKFEYIAPLVWGE